MSGSKIKIEDIDASLTCAKILASKEWKIGILIIYILSGISAAGFIFLLIFIPIMTGEFNDNAIASIWGLGLSGIIIIMVVLIQVPINKNKKKAELWIQDAVILDAHARSLGQTSVPGKVFLKKTAIEVDFRYNNKRITRQSIYKNDLLYSVAYTKYADKDIMIAYSPKYDEVMLIKPSHVRRIIGD